MPSYTYKIGKRAPSGPGLSVVAHSTMFVVATFGEALEKAKRLTAESAWTEADRAVLLDETGVIYPVFDGASGPRNDA